MFILTNTTKWSSGTSWRVVQSSEILVQPQNVMSMI